MIVEIEQRIAAAPPEEEWRLVGQLLDACPLGLSIEPVAGVDGFDLHVEQGYVSRHDLLALEDALEQALEAEIQQPAALHHALKIARDLLEAPADQGDAT